MASTRVSWSVGPDELMVTMEDLRAALVDTGAATKADAHAAKTTRKQGKTFAVCTVVPICVCVSTCVPVDQYVCTSMFVPVCMVVPVCLCQYQYVSRVGFDTARAASVFSW